MNHFHNYLQIFTDGSKDQTDHVGTGVNVPQFQIHLANRITDKLSVYAAEMMAVIIGLQWVEEEDLTESSCVMTLLQSL